MSAVEEHKPVEKRRALGRGLDSLLPSGPRIVNSPAAVPPPPVIPPANPAIAPQAKTEATEISSHARRDSDPETGVPQVSPNLRDLGAAVIELPLDLIDENPYQTRRTFDESTLAELAESIKAHGLAQPIVVRPGSNGHYVLVLGERRCRASKLAGKTTVAAIVRQLGNEQAAEMTIVENLQRQDLNCLEQAQAFARLSREFSLTQEQIGQRTGVSRESVANYMRLLKLPESVLAQVGEGKLGFSEARLLLEASAFLDPAGVERMAQNAIQFQWTVKELKAQVDYLQNPVRDSAEPKEKLVDPNVRDAERKLRDALGMRVKVIDHKGNKGQIVIRYESLADFDRVLELLGRQN